MSHYDCDVSCKDTERLIVIHSTFVVGPDGREFDLRDGSFPRRKDYIAKNAYTRPIDTKENEK